MSKCLHTFVSLASLFFGIVLLLTSSWALYRSVQRRGSTTEAKKLLSQVNEYFGGTTTVHDSLDLIYRIVISISAMSLIAAFFQIIFAVFLLFSTVTTSKLSESERRMARMWVFAETLIMLGLLAGEICIAVNDLRVQDEIQVFLAVAGLDIMFLLISSLFVCVYSFRSDYRDF